MSASRFDLGHALLDQARKCINGANVHRFKTAIFCYETSLPNSKQRAIYEEGLRNLVRDFNRNTVARIYAEAACQRAKDAKAASDILQNRNWLALARHVTPAMHARYSTS